MGSNIQSVVAMQVTVSEPREGTEERVLDSALTAMKRRKISPLLWLSGNCLDAPIVAVSWQWLFARTLHARIRIADCLVLLLTAWIIYLVDRVADSFTIPRNQPTSARQRFCLQHRSLMIGIMAALALADAICVFRALNRATFLFGAIIAAAIGFYLAVNHLAPVIWQKVPLKEVSIGLLFALGTIAAIQDRSLVLPLPTFFFAALCALNCLSISVWERPLDLAQGRVTFATVHPRLRRIPEIASWLLALVGLLLALSSALRLFGFCIASSAAAVAILNRAGALSRDERVALADVVLLSPVLLCVGTWSLK
jgi:hypothetical protein